MQVGRILSGFPISQSLRLPGSLEARNLKKGAGMRRNRNESRGISLEEVALYQMLLSEAIFEILARKGLITDAEVAEQIDKMRGGSDNSDTDALPHLRVRAQSSRSKEFAESLHRSAAQKSSRL
jgi:hypothetical protein